MTGRFISYLDLMCCGFGGAMLMFLIVASAQTNPVSGLPMLVIRAKAIHEGQLPLDQAIEFGIQYRKKGDTKWQRANGTLSHESIAQDGTQAWFFTSRAIEENSSEAVFICNRPRSGTWETRAYSASITSEDSSSEPGRGREFKPIEVQVEVLGSTVATQARSTIWRSAQFTKTLEFRIQGRD